MGAPGGGREAEDGLLVGGTIGINFPASLVVIIAKIVDYHHVIVMQMAHVLVELLVFFIIEDKIVHEHMLTRLPVERCQSLFGHLPSRHLQRPLLLIYCKLPVMQFLR